MTPNERVEAAARAVTCAMSGLGFVMPPAYARPIARAALSTAGVAELEAENVRLRGIERGWKCDRQAWADERDQVKAERDAARRELADLRVAVAVLRDHALGLSNHVNLGQCPEAPNYTNDRDRNCPVCVAIDQADA